MAAEAPHRTLLTNENFKTMTTFTQIIVASALITLPYLMLNEVRAILDILKNNNNDDE